MVQQTIDYGLRDIDLAIEEGVSSFEIWTRMGRRQGLTLEDIVMRRRTLRSPPPAPKRRRRATQGDVLPLFSFRPVAAG